MEFLTLVFAALAPAESAGSVSDKTQSWDLCEARLGLIELEYLAAVQSHEYALSAARNMVEQTLFRPGSISRLHGIHEVH